MTATITACSVPIMTAPVVMVQQHIFGALPIVANAGYADALSVYAYVSRVEMCGMCVWCVCTCMLLLLGHPS
jgi:hypothetical protein